MPSKFFLKGLGSFEQDVRVTEQIVRDVMIEPGDEVVVQVRAKVRGVAKGESGIEVDLQDVTPHKIVAVIRQKGGAAK